MRRLLHNLNTMRTDDGVGSDGFVERALATDCRWPILVFREKDGKLHVLDGTHRLWKAKHYGRTKISGRIVPLKDLLNVTHY